MIGFERKREFNDYMNANLLGLQGDLSSKQMDKLRRIKQAWNFYEGFHWEDLPETDSPETTINYCRAFVDKFIAFELGKGFTMSTHKDYEQIPITPDGRSSFKYLEDIWEDNSQYLLTTEIGQMKSITGEAWVQVRYFAPDELDDPFGKYPDGRIKIMLMPTSVMYPEYDPHQKDVLKNLTIMYTYERTRRIGLMKKPKKEQVLFKQVWTKDECTTQYGKDEPIVSPNRYGTIPFVCIKNLPLANKNDGRSDLDDLIPLNTEYNMKKSNVSEILDYHSAPVTVVYGAKIGNLEKGANKMWGGLSKEARVENLELKGDLSASGNYTNDLKLSMCEVGGVPETVLGGAQSISNTSGVALQYMNLPLVEKTRIKRACTEDGLERLNSIILLVSLFEGFVFKPASVPIREFFWNAVTLPDTLPKDELLELQKAKEEMTMGIESRKNIMQRVGKENVEELIEEIDQDMKDNPEIYGKQKETQLNSGFTNGQTPVEQVRTEMTGKNGGE